MYTTYNAFLLFANSYTHVCYYTTGPRYIVFHPTFNMAYCINELSSTISVFEFNSAKASMLEPGSDVSTLRFVQSISTIPTAFPGKLNTCGRIAIDPR